MGTLLQTDIAGPKMPARNAQKEKEVLQWVEGVMGEPLPAGDFGEVLKDGVVLCKLINKIQPGSVKKFKEKEPMLGPPRQAMGAWGTQDTRKQLSCHAMSCHGQHKTHVNNCYGHCHNFKMCVYLYGMI